jgi:hypothetical protein
MWQYLDGQIDIEEESRRNLSVQPAQAVVALERGRGSKLLLHAFTLFLFSLLWLTCLLPFDVCHLSARHLLACWVAAIPSHLRLLVYFEYQQPHLLLLLIVHQRRRRRKKVRTHRSATATTSSSSSSSSNNSIELLNIT